MPDDFPLGGDASPQMGAALEGASNSDDPNSFGGEGYPHLPEDLQSSMRELVFEYEQQNMLARLSQIRMILQNREFYAGRQVSYWNQNEARYVVPTAEQLGVSDEEYTQAVELITNLIAGKIQIVMAELSQSPPRTAFTPSHAKVQADVKLAKDADNIVKYMNGENNIDEKLAYEVWLLCTDASFAEYWRFVRDEKFGIEEYEVEVGQKEVELVGNRAVCRACGYQEPAASPETAPPACKLCGAPMGPESFAPRESETYSIIGKGTRPAGREVCDVVGMLELVIPAYEKNEEELGFLTWCREVHTAKLMAIFPEAAAKIQAGGGTGNAAAPTERIARLSLLSGQRFYDGQTSLATFRETWFRPWTYQTLKQKSPDIFKRLNDVFPDGFRVAFAGDTYCGSWPEKLQDHWTICHDLPGDGQYRRPLASDAVATQRKYNKCDNIQIDTYEAGLSFMVTDTDLWNGQALPGRTEANAVYGVQGRGNKTVSNSTWQSSPAQVSPQLIAYQNGSDRIMDAQFGTYAPMYGGDTQGNDTAHGIAIERNAAKGRLGLVFRAIKNFRARADLKNIRLFLANRTQDVEIAVAGPGSEYDSVQISLADIRDGNVQIEENADESFPVSLNEQRTTVNALFNNQNPEVMAWFAEIENAQQYLELNGMDQLITIPGADSREKCYDIIAQLIQSGPMAAPPPPPPPPEMMQPGMPPPIPPPPGPPEPSIQPDPVLDNLPIYVKTCQEWAASEAGRKAMLENQAGYENVKAFVAKCQMLLAPPPMPPGAPPPDANGGTQGKPKQLPVSPESNPGGPMEGVM
jgi:hypothetical protein